MSAPKVTFQCGEALTISQAAELHQQLRKTMEGSSTIELAADSVEKVDTAGLQLLVALFRELEKVGGTVTWKQPSDTLVQAATTLGLVEHLAIN